MIPIPYGFLPLAPEQAVHDAPLWRDGSSRESRVSGELLLTLEALTPLVVGNHQHKVDDKHSVLVPQMLDDGRVLIGATSLKGMLRAVLSGLLQVPMTQVAEHHYSYRPNFGFGPKENPLREVRAAIIVESTESKGDASELIVKLLPKDCAVVFVRDEAQKALGKTNPGEHLQSQYDGIELTGNAPRMRLEAKRDRQANLDHVFLAYRGGIDGAGHLASAFNARSQVYQAVLVPAGAYKSAKAVTISKRIFEAYQRTQKDILADIKVGHLSSGHPLAGKLGDDARNATLKNASLQPQQLIYVEIEYGKTASGKQGMRVTSMGHHFQYRWAYTSSVRCKNRLLDGKGELRAELAPHPQERAGDNGAPQRLTGSRLLFGYALDGKDDELQFLATGSFKRLAGRLAFNTAIEDIAGKTDDQRFVDGGHEVQLKILGMPRPSAVEFYLKQTALPKALVTYGDLPSDPGGDLAGRKFYRHQPDAKTDRKLYIPGIADKKADANVEERGTLVRYLSAIGSRFRCTLRFDSLRPWELGALLVALDPALIEPLFGMKHHEEGYAHKLGYGKPLGLGSVRLTLDAARWHEDDSWCWQQARRDESQWNEWVNSSLTAFKTILETHLGEDARKHLEAWCVARRWTERGRAGYHTVPDKCGNETIYNFHTDMRRRHANVRRGKPGNFKDLNELLKSGESKPL